MNETVSWIFFSLTNLTFFGSRKTIYCFEVWHYSQKLFDIQVKRSHNYADLELQLNFEIFQVHKIMHNYHTVITSILTCAEKMHTIYADTFYITLFFAITYSATGRYLLKIFVLHQYTWQLLYFELWKQKDTCYGTYALSLRILSRNKKKTFLKFNIHDLKKRSTDAEIWLLLGIGYNIKNFCNLSKNISFIIFWHSFLANACKNFAALLLTPKTCTKV